MKKPLTGLQLYGEKVYYIQTAIKCGGYIVVGSLKESRGYWFNIEDAVFELNTATNIEPLHLLRCNGERTVLTKSELENRLMKDLLENEWAYVYRYNRERKESLIPEGFETAEYVCEIKKGKWGVFDKKMRLITYVPETTAVYLHGYVELALINPKAF